MTNKTLRSFSISFFAALILVFTTMHVYAQGEPFTLNIAEQTFTFYTTSPDGSVKGLMTITLGGSFEAIRLKRSRKVGQLQIDGGESGTFKFVPYEADEPTVTGKFKFGLTGYTKPHTDVIDFWFKMDGETADGVPVTFTQSQRAFLNEAGVEITLGDTRRVIVNSENRKNVLPSDSGPR